MKKYETPMLELRTVGTVTFLSASGDATAVDKFDDNYGSSFGQTEL